MKNLIKRWLDIQLYDIVVDECSCCDDVVTADDILDDMLSRIDMLEEKASPKKKEKTIKF